MVERKVTILNKYGLHVRPSTQFAQAAGGFECRVTVTTADGREADGASLLALLSLGIQGGSDLTLKTEGEGEQEAMDALCDLVASQFGLRYDE